MEEFLADGQTREALRRLSQLPRSRIIGNWLLAAFRKPVPLASRKPLNLLEGNGEGQVFQKQLILERLLGDRVERAPNQIAPYRHRTTAEYMYRGGDKSPTWICQMLRPGSRRLRRGYTGYGALSEKSSKIFSCPASPSARRTASWKSLSEYRTIAGGVSAPFANMLRRSLVAARTSASGRELTQRGSHHPRTVVVE